MDISKKLDELEKEIESAKEDKARLEGMVETPQRWGNSNECDTPWHHQP